MPTEDIQSGVVGIFRAHTLYPEHKLGLDIHLERDLGIDSVVLQSIVADVRQRYALPEADLGVDGLRTIGDVITRVAATTGAAAKTKTNPDAVVGGQPDDLTAKVLDVVQRHTQYTLARLRLDAALEGDLGIDSVVLQSIVADLDSELALPRGSLQPAGLGRIRDLVDAVRVAGGHGTGQSQGLGPARAPTALASAPASPAGSARPELVVSPPTREAPMARPSADLGTELAGIVGRELDARRTFMVQGVSAAQRAQIVDAVSRRLSGTAELKIDQCDTVEKLEQFLDAARAHALADPPGVRDATPPLDQSAWDGRSMKDFVEERSPDLFAKARSFDRFFKQRQAQNLYWYGMPLESACKNRAIIYDEVAGRRREFLMFASNNYLGLANHPKVIEAITTAYRSFGATNTGCRLIGGTNYLHKELERRLARLKGTEACVIFPSGYSANLGTISALVKRNDCVIIDKFNHMSIVDGCKLSGGQRRIYAHNDMQDLERVLQNCAGEVDGKLIVTDGVFSMHGDICNAPEIVALARKYGARVLLDDAHSTGVLGRRGSGTAEHFGLEGGRDVDLELGTMSKTLAGLGGFVCGDEDVIDYLRFYANSYVFAANIPAGVAAGLIASIDVMESETWRLKQLWDNIHLLKGGLEGYGFDTGGANSAIIPIVIGDDHKTLEYGRAVRARGLFCQTVVYPGVSVGDARLRVSVSAEHERADLEDALTIFVDAAREVGVLPEARA